MFGFIKNLFGTKRDRDVKRLEFEVLVINGIEEEYQALSEDEFKAKTGEFRQRIKDGETLDDIKCEAFAAVKNACRRLMGTNVNVCGHEQVWDMIPYDVQLIGGMVLHEGKIAEMATGEGKTLVATMPMYLNALTGKCAHLVTTNDFLARRDAQWMGHLYNYLGLTVGCIQNQMSFMQRGEEYGCDITYGTNSEFGFDYLRDNGMAYSPEGLVQRGHYYALIDEVDSILIDEARTPLIISGPAQHSSHQFTDLKPKVEGLVRKQRSLVTGMITDVKKHLEAGETESAQYLLYQIRQGMPRHKQLMHMLEDNETRKLMEQVETMLLSDIRKDQARALREELYFTIDERSHEANLTEQGCEGLSPNDPDAFVLPDLVSAMSDIDAEEGLSDQDRARRMQEMQASFADRTERIHNVDQLIRAYCLYEKDVQYVIQNNQVVIVDEYTGRLMAGRRWSDGLHQAVEAKEGVKIERETQTLATITIQNYFRMYEKLSGMTGTAETEAAEFREIYKLDTVVIPTNRPVRRADGNDVIYKTMREKYNAVIEEIGDANQRGQPVLVGTVSVEHSELISRMLKRAGIIHTVLNAKNHEGESEIVRRAGQPGAVTIATNMAGRGTDIKLGEGVVWVPRDTITSQIALDDSYDGSTLREKILDKPCGLYVIASERHESRRIDRQLRGRCARQGDPGMSRFFISLEDDLMRLFGSDRIAGIMSRLGMEEGEPLEHKWLNRSIETAQRRVEQQNFGIRKRTLQYDDVMNKQREVIYGFRGQIVQADNIREQIYDTLYDVISAQIESILMEDQGDEAIRMFTEWIHSAFPIPVRESDIKGKVADPEALLDFLFGHVKRSYDLKVSIEDDEGARLMERQVLLQSVDTHWQEYLRGMDELRHSVHLRAYGQRDPLVEYKREAYKMFEDLMWQIKSDIATSVFRSTTSIDSFEQFMSQVPQQLVHDEVSILGDSAAAGRGCALAGGTTVDTEEVARSMIDKDASTVKRDDPKVGRNDPCPCGSGKKYKKCCGRS